MDELLKRQYETFPYPQRHPDDEARRLLTGTPSHLLEINHYVFGGRLDSRAPFRALIAGGGTGDAAIMLAQQLADTNSPGRVVYLDISSTSRRIAEARARVRGLSNIEFREGSLLELEEMDLGPFDYIDCCGVLHHLADPTEGLRMLARALQPYGGIGLMLYGELGRTGVYFAQEALRMLFRKDEPPTQQVALARRFLGALPPTNWLRRNPYVKDHLTGGDAGIYDLLLHTRDRPYRVPQILELLDAAGLRLVSFIEPALYDPVTYLTDPKLRRRTEGLDMGQRAALAELVVGNLFTHVLYAVPREHPQHDPMTVPDEPNCVPVVIDGVGEVLASHIAPDRTFTFHAPEVPLRFELPRGAADLVRLVDNQRTLRSIRSEYERTAGYRMGWRAFLARFQAVFRVFGGLNLMVFLRPPEPAR